MENATKTTMQIEAPRIIIVMAFPLLREDENILLRERENAQPTSNAPSVAKDGMIAFMLRALRYRNYRLCRFFNTDGPIARSPDCGH